MLICVLVFIFYFVPTSFEQQMYEGGTVTSDGGNQTQTIIHANFDAINWNLFYEETRDCGESDYDCPVYYNPSTIVESIHYMEKNIEVLQPLIDTRYLETREKATGQCGKEGGDQLLNKESGGWCLSTSRRWVGCLDVSFKVGCKIEPNGRDPIPVPEYHALPSKVVVNELIKLIDDEGIESFNDFGAGIGQYKAAVQNLRPEVTWTSYDGAGNVEEWTKNFVKWVDLTKPLSLPKADWVMSLEVGEHIPNQYEGMFLRNLHHHNCRGMYVRLIDMLYYCWCRCFMYTSYLMNHFSVNFSINLFFFVQYSELGSVGTRWEESH